MSDKGREYVKLAESVYHQADAMRSVWDWLSRTVMPRKNDVLRQIQRGAESVREHVSVACASLLTLVSAHNSLVTPHNQQWFSFREAEVKAGEKYERWFMNATEVTARELAKSNFYAAKQEVDLDRGLFGTGCLFCEDRKGGGVQFRHVPVGSFGFALNEAGDVDTVVRKFEFTAHQAVERWGYGKVPVKVQEAFDRLERRFDDRFEFWHLVTPRKGYSPGNRDKDLGPLKMRYASVYIFNGEQRVIVEEGGYQELPYMVTRFLSWGEGTVWGYPPALNCAEDLRGLVRVEKTLDLLADLSVFPRVFQDAEQVGDIDFRPGGRTVVDREVNHLGLPREWGSQGRYDVGVERIRMAEERIRMAFYVPFLQPITHLEPGVTATEVMARQEEQALSFSSTFARYVADLNALMGRVFACLWRQGKFEMAGAKVPVEYAVRGVNDGKLLRVPEVAYHGKLAQTIERAQAQSLDYTVQQAANYGQLDPQALDYIDLGRAVRHQFVAQGAPSEVFRSEEEVEALRAQRQQEAMLQQQLAAAQGMNQEAQAYRNMRQ